MQTKIVIVITGMSFGGAERVTANLSNYFVSCGNDVTIISLTKTEPAYRLSEKIHYIWFDESLRKNAVHRDIALIANIRKEIKKLKPNLILGMMSYSGALAAYACAGLNIPVLLSERNDPNTSIAFKNIEKLIIKFAYRHLASDAVFQTLAAKEYYFGKKDKGFIIPNPLYLEDMPAANQGMNMSFRIISAGRLSRQKNYELLIRAFVKVHAKYPRYTLTIFGEGEKRKDLETLISDLGLIDSVFLPGIENNIFTQMQNAECFVMSSLYEGMPNALIEAMAMGLPVITTDYSEGRGTVVDDKKNGLIVPRNNENALSDAMMFFIENQKDAEKMGKRASAIRERLDSNLICKQWLNCIEECVARKCQ